MTHLKTRLLFVLLSVADLALTCWLIKRSGGHVYEANPVAGWWLAQHGLGGLVCYKVLAVALVLGLASLIARSRPRAAGRVLGLGCAATAFIVVYSATLSHAAMLTPAERRAQAEREAARHEAAINRQARRSFLQREVFWALVDRSADDLRAGRISLRQAAGRLAASERGRDATMRRSLAARYVGLPPGETFAMVVVSRAVHSQPGGPRAARRLARRLEREFQLTYGSAPPLEYRADLPAPPTGDDESEEPNPAAGRQG
jgi:hypothetical protein